MFDEDFDSVKYHSDNASLSGWEIGFFKNQENDEDE